MNTTAAIRTRAGTPAADSATSHPTLRVGGLMAQGMCFLSSSFLRGRRTWNASSSGKSWRGLLAQTGAVGISRSSGSASTALGAWNIVPHPAHRTLFPTDLAVNLSFRRHFGQVTTLDIGSPYSPCRSSAVPSLRHYDLSETINPRELAGGVPVSAVGDGRGRRPVSGRRPARRASRAVDLVHFSL